MLLKNLLANIEKVHYRNVYNFVYCVGSIDGKCRRCDAIYNVLYFTSITNQMYAGVAFSAFVTEQKCNRRSF